MTTAKKKIGNTGSAANAVITTTVAATVSRTPVKPLARTAVKVGHPAKD